MNTKLNFFALFTVLMIAGMFFVSCEKESMVLAEQPELNEPLFNMKATSSVTYYSSPTVGNYTSNSSSSVTIGGNCGIHSGGILRAKLQSKSGNQFTVRISKQDGSNFGIAGTAYVKAASLCGGIAGQASYSAGVSYVDVTFYATFSRGIVNFYPMTIDGSYGYRYYAEPILVYTSPMYISNWVYGANLGSVNGANVYCNGTSNLSSGYYQCTEFCNRYYSQVYGLNIINTGSQGGNANTWYGNASAKGLVAYANGGTVEPRPGDILCMSGGSQGYGHVAIIIQVTSSFIKIAHQNSGTSWAPIGAQISRSGTTVSNPTGYTIQGWLRAPSYQY
jgi:surface antigen